MPAFEQHSVCACPLAQQQRPPSGPEVVFEKKYSAERLVNHPSTFQGTWHRHAETQLTACAHATCPKPSPPSGHRRCRRWRWCRSLPRDVPATAVKLYKTVAGVAVLASSRCALQLRIPLPCTDRGRTPGDATTCKARAGKSARQEHQLASACSRFPHRRHFRRARLLSTKSLLAPGRDRAARGPRAEGGPLVAGRT